MKRLVDSVKARYGSYQRAPDFTGSSLTLARSEDLGGYRTCKYGLVCGGKNFKAGEKVLMILVKEASG